MDFKIFHIYFIQSTHWHFPVLGDNCRYKYITAIWGGVDFLKSPSHHLCHPELSIFQVRTQSICRLCCLQRKKKLSTAMSHTSNSNQVSIVVKIVRIMLAAG